MTLERGPSAPAGSEAVSGRAPVLGVRVTRMRPRHLRQVLAIERQAYPRPWPLEVFSTELERDDRRYLVAEAHRGWLRPRRVLGYAGLLFQVDEAHVTTIAVDPSQHRRKVATHLLLALLEEARAAGAQAATLEVRAANHGAQRLYGAFGFVPEGVRPGYYRETGEDAVIMWARDLQGDDMAARLASQRARLATPGGASGAPDHPVPWVPDRVGLPEPRAGETRSGTTTGSPGTPPSARRQAQPPHDPQPHEEGEG